MDFPDLAKAGCSEFSVCTTLPAAAGETPERLREGEAGPLFAKCSQTNGDAFVRVVRPLGDKARHLHIDFRMASTFPQGQFPEVNIEPGELQSLLDEFGVTPVDATSRIVLELPYDKVPLGSPIRRMADPTKAGQATVRVTGVTFELDGSPIRVVGWSLASGPSGGEADRDVSFELEADVSLNLQRDYLCSALEHTRELADSFLAGGTAHGDRP
jgi:hypothetical protein